jgi:CRISPR-associated protein Csx17
VDRGIERFVRYSLLKRRGDSYVALPVGTFEAGYRNDADRIRQFQTFFDRLNQSELPRGAEELRRAVDAAIYNVLLKGGTERTRELMAALGRMLRRMVTTSETRLPSRGLNAQDWLDACGFEFAGVRIAAALASIFTRDVGSLADNLSRADRRFAWTGGDLASRMISVLERRLQLANAAESDANPLGGACALQPGDATTFIEGSVDDALIEDLLFAFATLDWKDFKAPSQEKSCEVLPVYAVLKHLFLPGEIKRGPEPKKLRGDPRVLSLLKAGNVEEAAGMAVHRLRVAGFRPLEVDYMGGMDATRLAASLLIPVLQSWALGAGIFHEEKENS